MGVTTALIALTIVLAYNRFVKRTTLDPEPEKLPLLQRLIAHKWLVDELYAKLFERPYGWLSAHFYSIAERQFMVPLMVGTGGVTNKVGKALRRLQSGNMSFYLFGMVIGLIALLAWTLYKV